MKCIPFKQWMGVLMLSFLSAAAYEVPVNDLFANATLLTGQEGSVGYFDLSSATDEAEEPFGSGTCYWNPLNVPERSVWFKFVAPKFGKLTAGTFLHVAVDFYKGTGLANLQYIAPSVSVAGREVFMDKGELYYIQLHDCSTDHMAIPFSYSFKFFAVAQALDFPALADRPFSHDPIALQATAESGLPVEFFVEEGNAILNGNLLTPRTPGTITVAAFQRGNADYISAYAYRTFVVTESAQSPPRPGNDDWSNAFDLGTASSVSVLGTTLGARHEPHEPWDSNIVAAVWFKWTPSITGGVRYQIKSGTPHIRVYQPFSETPFWQEIARNGLSFLAQAGSAYYIAVFAAAEPGPFEFTASISPPPNDDFGNAETLRAVDDIVVVSGSVLSATREPGEPDIPGAPGTVWYRWVPEFSGRVEYGLDFFGNGSIPKVAVYRSTGSSLADLIPVSAANDRPNVVAGRTYYLAVYGLTVPFRFLLQKSPQAPFNDNFANAVPLPTLFGLSTSTFGATREPFEPYNELGLNSTWYIWRPNLSQHVTFTQSSGDATIFEATGSSIHDLVPLGKPGKRIYFSAGRTYYIALYNKFGSPAVDFGADFGSNTDSNDPFLGALPLDFGANGSAVKFVSLQGASLEPNEPSPPGSMGSLWYLVRVPSPSYLTFRVGEANVRCTIFAGSVLSELSPINGGLLYPDIEYRVAVNAIGNVPNPFELKATLSPPDHPPAPNDNFADALPFTSATESVRGYFRQATIEPHEPPINPEGWPATSRTLWWKYSADRAGVLLIWSSDFAMKFSVYKGTSLADLERLPSREAMVAVQVQPGETYYLQAEGPEFSRLTESVQIRFLDSVPNDNFETAALLTSPSGSLAFQNLSATLQPGEPSMGADSAGRTVWFTWVAPSAQEITFWCSQGFLQLYRGSDWPSLSPVPSTFNWPTSRHWSGRIPVQANERLYIQVDSQAELSPFLLVNWQTGTSLERPANDSVASAAWLSGSPGLAPSSSFKDVPLRSSEPEIFNGPHKALWWRWYAPLYGKANIVVPSLSPGPFVAGLYERDPNGNLNFLGTGSEIIVQTGHLYYIAVVASPQEEGQIGLMAAVDQNGLQIYFDQENLLQNGYFWSGAPSFAWSFTGLPSTITSDNKLRMPASPAGIYQSISVEPGKLYSVGLLYEGLDGYSRLAVKWNDALLGVAEMDVASSRGAVWTNYYVRATTSTAKIALENLVGPTSISMIQVKPVPNALSEGPETTQTITFPPLNDIPAGSGPIFLQASASSGLPIEFSVESGPATIQGHVLTATGLGPVAVIASQPGNPTYYPAPEERRTFKVTRQPQSLTFEPNFPEADAVPLYAVASSGLPVTFQVLSGPGLIVGQTLSSTGPGAITVEASQSGNETFEPAAPVVRNITLRRLPQIIDILVADQPNSPAGRPGPRAFAVASHSVSVQGLASSGLPVTMSVLSGAATLNGSLLTISGGSEVVVRATQSGDSLYRAASADYRFAPFAKAEQTILFDPLPNIPITTGSINLHATASSGLPVQFTWVNGSATLNGSVLTWNVAGTVTVRATQAGDEQFLPAPPVERSFEVTRLPQSIAFADLPPLQLGGAPRPLAATASSGLPVVFQLISGPGQLQGDTLTATGAGTLVVRATQSGNGTYLPVALDREIIASRAAQSIRFDPLSDIPVSTQSILLSAAASSGLPVSFTVLSGPATISGTQLTLQGAGPITLRATQAGNEQFDPAPPIERSFEVTRLPQTITFPDVPPLRAGDAPRPLAATASSGLPVTFQLISGSGQLQGDTLAATGAGTLVVRATQSGNSTYLPVALDREIIASRGTQSILFDPLSDIPVSTKSINLSATASSGLPVSFTVLAGPATVAGTQLTITGVGRITLRATQTGNERFETAAPVDRSFEVTRLPQTITLTALPALRFGDPAVKLAGTSSSRLALEFQLLSGPAELSDDFLTPTGAGSVLLRVSQSGDSTWLPATPLEATLTIGKARQTIDFPPPATPLTPGSRVHLTATASSGLPVTFRIISGPGELDIEDFLRANGLGAIIVEASPAGDPNYESASVQQTINTFGPPELAVALSNGRLLLSWPENQSGFQLESAPTLAGPWSPVTLAPPAGIAIDGQSRFFRLKTE